MTTILVDGSSFYIGIIKDLNLANTKNIVVIPGVSDGEAPETLKMGEDYLTYTFSTRFYSTSVSDINTFERTLIGYCKELKAAKIRRTGETSSSYDIDVVFYTWTKSETNASPLYRDYTITFVEGTLLA